MERKNIAFQYGIHRSPSSGNDGELSECINMEVHNGELTPSVLPEIAFTLEDGDKLLFVHKSGNYNNYIIQKGPELCWFPDDDKESVRTIGEITPKSIHSVGNTIVVLSEDNMEYIVFKSGKYKRIGNKPPFCSISFGLRTSTIQSYSIFELITWDFLSGCNTDKATSFPDKYYEYKKGETTTFDFNFKSDYLSSDSISDPESTPNLSDAINIVSKLTESFHAADNKLRAVCDKYGHFCDTFFIRYAYRMYDGSHYMHSAPILMPLNVAGTNSAAWSVIGRDRGSGLNGRCDVNAKLADFRIVGFYVGSEKVEDDRILDWEDLIDGIDIFVSPGIRRYSPDAKIYGFTSETTKLDGLCFVGSEKTYLSGSRGTRPGYDFIHDIYKNHEYESVSQRLDIEIKEIDYFIDEISKQSLFYKVSSFNLKNLINLCSEEDRQILKIKENVLPNLEQQERLVDDYDSHNAIIPSFAHVYNGRLNISGISTELFPGYPLESMVPYTYDASGVNKLWTTQTRLEVDGREIILVSKSNIELYNAPSFLYYPSANAKDMTVYMYGSKVDNSSIPSVVKVVSLIATFDLKPHILLNGAYYLSESFGVDDDYEDAPVGTVLEPSGSPYLSKPNMIYTSDVNNPYFFPLSGRNTVGTGNIVAIASNTKAISPGQFGQYPLIVFSTDGIWAMQTGDDGLYYSIHPISKDIISNPNVLQTDGPILFVTENGLHSIITDSVTHLSTLIKGRPDKVEYPLLDNEFDDIIRYGSDRDTFNEYIKDAMFSYDYINSRAIIFRPDKNYSYIYSIDSGMFSKMVLSNGESSVSFHNTVNAYPDVYMQSMNSIYTFSYDTDNEENIYRGVVVTRPMVFSDPLSMKSIKDLRIIHNRQQNEITGCKYIIQVSNDGYHWAVKRSLRGHSFKQFRFIILPTIADNESLVGMSVTYDYRRIGKLR